MKKKLFFISVIVLGLIAITSCKKSTCVCTWDDGTTTSFEMTKNKICPKHVTQGTCVEEFE